MLQKIWKKKEYLAIVLVLLLFIGVSIVSLVAIDEMQGHARVVNYAGIVRGGTQRLVKSEVMGHQNDGLIDRLDSIVDELLTGEGPFDLVVLKDDKYLDLLSQVKESWGVLKEEIYNVRNGASPERLFTLSEDYFVLCNDTVGAAEEFSEKKVNNMTGIITGIFIVFALVLVVGLGLAIRGLSVGRRADMLGKIAYIDSLTEIDNRASCEQKIEALTVKNPAYNLCVFMFDMNNLKLANDLIGHRGGDKIIREFAAIIKSAAEKYGFVGRYGGDEFIGIFENATEEDAMIFLADVDKRVSEYNTLCVNEIEKISYAVGFVVGSITDSPLEDLINEADRTMYINKRKMKNLL